MEYKKFEQHIAQTLQDDTSLVDIQALIANLHPKKNDKRRFLWLWYSIGILCVAGGLYFTATTGQTESKQVFMPEKEIGHGKSMTVTAEISNLPVKRSSGRDKQAISNEKNVANTQMLWSSRGNIVISHPISAQEKEEKRGLLVSEKPSTSSSLSEISFNENSAAQENRTGQNMVEFLKEKTSVSYLSPLKRRALQVNTDKIVCPSFSNKGRMYLEIIPEIGMIQPFKKLEVNNTESDNVYLLRDKNEKSQIGWSAGLYARLRKQKSPLYLKAGLSYSRLTEKMPLDYSYTRQDTTQGIISVTVSQTGDTITYIYGDIIQQRKISGNKTKHYSLSLIDLPISLGAEKRLGTWSAGIEGGVIINLSMRSSGNILASDTSFVAADQPVNHFRNSIGLSYFGGVHIAKEIYGGGKIYLAARVRFIPESLSGDANRIRQTYQLAGLNVGYIHTF